MKSSPSVVSGRSLCGTILLLLTNSNMKELSPRADNHRPNFERSLTSTAPPVKERIPSLIVAVIDTGTDIHHPDLRSQIWQNPGEAGPLCCNSVDDDGNGFVDDVYGWNFAAHSADIQDRHGHGTHVAGIIAREGGVRVRIMVLKYLDASSHFKDPAEATAQAVDYALRMGAQVINYSSGGNSPQESEREAIFRASRYGIPFVAAAGNESNNSDLVPYYPADYEIPNIISVTALGPNQSILPTSNFGHRSVDVAAPGYRVWSTLPGGTHGPMTGTSQATAHVTGVLARLILTQGPGTPSQLMERVLKQGVRLPHLAPRVRTGAMVR